jgi:hypothetical protein
MACAAYSSARRDNSSFPSPRYHRGDGAELRSSSPVRFLSRENIVRRGQARRSVAYTHVRPYSIDRIGDRVKVQDRLRQRFERAHVPGLKSVYAVGSCACTELCEALILIL